MGPVGHRTLAALNGVAELATDEADLIDSLTTAVWAVGQHTGKLKWVKRVLIITDGTSDATVDDEQLEGICQEVWRHRAWLLSGG